MWGAGRGAGLGWPGLGVPYGAGSGCGRAVLVGLAGGLAGRSLRCLFEGQVAVAEDGQDKLSPTAAVMAAAGEAADRGQRRSRKQLR